MEINNTFDVIIIGGSYAGLSAAMSLGRFMRNVVIIDSGLPCNRQTPYSHNFLTQDGEKPGKITEKAKIQVAQYSTIQFYNDLAISGRKTEKGFIINTQAGAIFRAKKLIFATGIKDIIPSIKGFYDCWGTSIIHCPYCHGYEFRNHTTGIIANGERAYHLASLVNNLTKAITILTSGNVAFNNEQFTKLKKQNIKIVETEITAIEHKNGYIKNVVFKDNSKISFQAIYAPIPFKQHSDIPAALGCELTEQGYIKTDSSQTTTIKGIFACGDNTSMMRSVSNAVASGHFTGAMVNKELTEEQF